ncbi:MAG: VCBS repeat-containing protein [Nannocystaceae bacterium]|nr:VCBS repeat-containing protein [Nannocystaceae bacterium]
MCTRAPSLASRSSSVATLLLALAACRLVPNPAYDGAAASSDDGAPTSSGNGSTVTGITESSGSSGTDTSSSSSNGGASSGSTGDPVAQCYDGVVVPGELCYEYRPITAGFGEDAIAIATADFDGDGAQDMLSGNYAKFEIAYGDGNGGLRFLLTLVPSAMGISAITDVAAIDLDDDGVPDIVAASPDADTIDVVLADGEGGFDPPVPYTVSGRPHRMAVGDVDDDGAIDLAVLCDVSGELTMLWGTGDGGFELGTPVPAGTEPGDVSIGDIDDDDLPDLAIAAQDALIPFVNVGNRELVALDAFELATPITVMMSDLDDDGYTDMFLSTIAQENFVLFGVAGGGFVEEATWWNWTGRIAFAAAPGDFNSDGITDVAWGEGYLGNGGMTFMFGLGDRSFEAMLNPLYTFPQDLAVADFNGDGVPDVALANAGSVLAMGLMVSVP